MRRFGRITLLLVLLIPVAIGTALVLALFTEQGTRGVLREVERFLPLEIGYGSGSLGDRLYLESLRYTADGLHLEMQGVSAELVLDCLRRGVICFRELQVRDLDINLVAEAAGAGELSPEDAGETTVQLIEFPVPMETTSLDVGALRVRWTGGEWRQGELQGSVRLHKSRIEVLTARAVEPKLILRDVGEPEEPGPNPAVLPIIDLPLILSVYNLQLIAPVWELYGTDYQQDEISLRGEWQHTLLQLDKLEVRSRELGDLSLNGQLEFAGNWPLAAAVAVTLPQSLQYPGLVGTTANVSAEGDLSALAVKLDCAGPVSLSGEAQVNILDAALPYSAAVKAVSDAPLALSGIEGVPGLLRDASVAFPLEMSSSGSLRTQLFEVVGTASALGYDALRIVAQGQHESGKITLSTLSIEDASGGNELHANGDVMLSDGYSWSLLLESSGLDVPRISDAVKGRVDGSIQLAGSAEDGRWEARVVDVALQGQVNGLPARIRGFTGLDSELRLSASALQAQLNGAQLSAESPGEASGPSHLHLIVEDVGRWYSGGRGRFEANAEVSANREQVELRGSLQGLQWSGLSIERATVAGTYDLAAGHAFSLDTDWQQVSTPVTTFSELRLSAKGDALKQSIAVSGSGDIQGTLRVAGTLEGDQWQGTLAATQLQTPIGEWVLAEAVAISGSRSQEQVTLNAHCWRHQYAQLCPGALLLGAQGSGGVTLDSDLEILADILPSDLDVKGDVQLRLDARWAPEQAIVMSGKAATGAVLITQHFEEGDSASFGWDKADIGVTSTSAGLQIDGGMLRDSRRILALNLLLPPDRQEAISGSVVVNKLRLGALKPFVPSLSALAGELSGDVSLAGTIDRPQGFGKLALEGGHFAIAGNPTQLENLGLTLQVQGTGAKIRGAGLLGGGNLALTGRVDLDPTLQMELNIHGAEHNILYPPTTEMLISEALKVTLRKDLLELTGEINILDGVLEIEALPEGSVALSPSVIEVNAEGETLSEDLPFKQRINVQIHIEDRFRVTGDMLETTLGGDLRVQQRPGQPLQIFGNLNTSGGEFRAYQARLQIKRGTVSFTGPPTNPAVNVRAERRIASSGVTVGVRVQGPIEDDLQLEIYSDPTMSQTEAMSYLVRGRGIDAGAGLDGTSAALSMASGVVNRSELVNELNRIPGVSNIEFGAEGSDTDTAATVSGYLGERIYLSYGVGLYEPVNVLTTRFYLRSRLWLEVVSSIENSVDLYYSFDID
ncbi:MAG: translocation/assembly module TamB domain-containing protein [Halioglobus sp.]|nr:translocation/assembly module TamB domain-containing protein [Halioglobus sp.]